MTLRLRVWNARSPSDYAEWEELYYKWRAREVFAHPAYVSLFAEPGDTPVGVFASTPGGWILYPTIVRQIPVEAFGSAAEGCRDLISPYGYGGAVFEGDGAQHAASFWREFDGWAAGEQVIAEFVRFLLFPESLVSYPGEVEQKSWNVIRSLELSEDEIWREFEHKVRKNVNKARRSGVSVEIDQTGERLDDFLKVYSGTMNRRSAATTFYFPRSFFETISSRLTGQFAFFYSVLEGRVLSVELALLSADSAYSFLGGTEEDAFEVRPNDLLKYEIMLFGKRTGKRRFVLGGGYSADDGIFRYKRSFAPNGVVPFKVGKRVLRPDIYERLVEARQRAGSRMDPAFAINLSYFPSYRVPLPPPTG